MGERAFRAPRLSQWGIPLEGEFSEEELKKAEAEAKAGSADEDDKSSVGDNFEAEDALARMLREALCDASVQATASALPKRETPHYWTLDGGVAAAHISDEEEKSTDLARASIEAELP